MDISAYEKPLKKHDAVDDCINIFNFFALFL